MKLAPTVSMLVGALLLGGCPPPTGRDRNDSGIALDGSDSAVCTSTPLAGGACSRTGERCSDWAYCPSLGSTVMRACTCTRGLWNCVSSGCAADAGILDGGQIPMCPTNAVEQGVWCGGYDGLTCAGGFYTDCSGRYQRAYCRCVDNAWSCPMAGCDAGVDVLTTRDVPAPRDVPTPGDATDTEAATDSGSGCPASPADGQLCGTVGLGCWYPTTEPGACFTYCNCEDTGRYRCGTYACMDAGR